MLRFPGEAQAAGKEVAAFPAGWAFIDRGAQYVAHEEDNGKGDVDDIASSENNCSSYEAAVRFYIGSINRTSLRLQTFELELA